MMMKFYRYEPGCPQEQNQKTEVNNGATEKAGKIARLKTAAFQPSEVVQNHLFGLPEGIYASGSRARRQEIVVYGMFQQAGIIAGIDSGIHSGRTLKG
jgi:hypothetical protein